MPRITHVRSDGCVKPEFSFDAPNVRERLTPFGGLRVYVAVPGFVGRALLRSGVRCDNWR